MDSLWDRLTLADLQRNFDPETMVDAVELVELGAVEVNDLDETATLSGRVRDRNRRYEVSVTPRENSLDMRCTCGGMRKGPCVHVLALLAGWVMTETGEEPEDLEFQVQPQRPAPVQKGPLPIDPSLQRKEIRADWQKRLEGMTVKQMRDLAAARGVKLKGTLRDQVQEGLLDELEKPAGMENALGRLPADSRRVLDILCALAGTTPYFNKGQVLPYLEAALANGLKARPVKDCLADLENSGLLIWPPLAMLYPVPDQVVANPGLNPDLFKPLAGEPERVEPAQPYLFTRAALRLLLLAQAGSLRCVPLPKNTGKNAWPGENGKSDNLENVIAPESDYLDPNQRRPLAVNLNLPEKPLDLAGQILEEKGFWARRAPEKTSDRSDEWLQLSPQEQSRRLFQQALEFPSQMELDLARPAGFTPWRGPQRAVKYPDFLGELSRARLRLARLLSRVPGGTWVEVESILRTVQGLQPGWTMEFASRQTNSIHAREWENVPVWASINRRRLDPLLYSDWRKAYGLFHQAILTQTFHWLGLVDVGWRDREPVAVRISEFGEYLLGRRDDFPGPLLPDPRSALAVRADGGLELDLDLAPLDLVNLVLLICAPERASANQIRKLVFRLDNQRLGRAFEAGWTLAEVTSRLEKACGATLPDSLTRRMQPLWERFGRLQLYEDMTLLEFADDFCLPELLASTKLSQILVCTFSPRLVAIRTGAADEFYAELQGRGYTPRLEGARGG